MRSSKVINTEGDDLDMGYKFYKFSVNSDDPEGEFLTSNLSAVTGAARNLLIRKLLLDYFNGEADKKKQCENEHDEVISKLDDLKMAIASVDKIENEITNLAEDIFRLQKSFDANVGMINETLRKILYIELPKITEARGESALKENVEFYDDLFEDDVELCDDSYIPDWIKPGYGNPGYRPDGYKRPDGIVIYPRGWDESRPYDRKENWDLEPEYIRKKYYKEI